MTFDARPIDPPLAYMLTVWHGEQAATFLLGRGALRRASQRAAYRRVYRDIFRLGPAVVRRGGA